MPEWGKFVVASVGGWVAILDRWPGGGYTVLWLRLSCFRRIIDVGGRAVWGTRQHIAALQKARVRRGHIPPGILIVA